MARSLAVLARPAFPPQFGNFINGKFVPPIDGQYFDNVSPIDGKVFIKAARSNAKDIDKALDAAHAAFPSWSNTSAAARSALLNRIADVIEKNLDHLAVVETIDNGKPVRETLAADLPLVIDHFRYFAGVIRAEEGTVAEIDANTVSINLHEPIGVVGQVSTLINKLCTSIFLT